MKNEMYRQCSTDKEMTGARKPIRIHFRIGFCYFLKGHSVIHLIAISIHPAT
jgi:hypothetical protein